MVFLFARYVHWLIYQIFLLLLFVDSQNIRGSSIPPTRVISRRHASLLSKQAEK